jgi:ketosteroid isomerase-like protein
MNKLIVLSIALLLSLSGFSQLTQTLAEEQIKMTMKFQESNWNRGDIEAYMEAYWKDDSLLFIGSRGPTYGWYKTLNNYKKSYPNESAMGQLHFELITLDLLSEKDAFVVGKWTLERATDTLDGYFSLLWRKINGEWKIIADHSSD